MSKEHEFADEYNCGEIWSTCDECGAEEVYHFHEGLDYKAAQEHIKEQGWSSRMVKGNWKDFCCDDCREQHLRTRSY